MSSKSSGYLILFAVVAAFLFLGWMTRARAEQYVVERYTTGTAKIIELHQEGDGGPMQVYQQGRFNAQCEGFRVLSGNDLGRCVTVRRERPNPQYRGQDIPGSLGQ